MTYPEFKTFKIKITFIPHKVGGKYLIIRTTSPNPMYIWRAAKLVMQLFHINSVKKIEFKSNQLLKVLKELLLNLITKELKK